MARQLAPDEPEAAWLIRVFPDADFLTFNSAVDACKAIANFCGDVTAGSYVTRMTFDRSYARMVNATALVAYYEGNADVLLAHIQDSDRNGLYYLWKHTADLSYLHKAVALGHCEAMLDYSKTVKDYAEKYVWYARVIIQINILDEEFKAILRTTRNIRIRLVLGCLFSRNRELKTYFGQGDTFYFECYRKVQEATQAWLIISRRLGICSDIRLLIGQLVWSNFVEFA